MEQEGQENKSGPVWGRRHFLTAVAGLTGGAVLGDALLLEPTGFEICEVCLRLPKIPPGRELRVVHLSDLHIRHYQSYHRQVAETVNALEPEVILLTGDYLERSRNLRDVLRFLELLKGTHGIFAVQGNWEYWSRLEGENLRRHFSRRGVTLLINERHDLNLQQVPLSILGLDYPSPGDALARLQEHSDANRINILLSHVPAFNHQLLDDSIDLILSGHTHGGQVRLPLLPPLYLPRYSGHFVKGLFSVGEHKTPLYVNRGIGTSLFSVRLFCRPEITLLRLQAQ